MKATRIICIAANTALLAAAMCNYLGLLPEALLLMSIAIFLVRLT